MAKKTTYTQKVTEIESIIDYFESEDVDFDQIKEKISRAVDLIDQCKAELKSSEEDIQKLLDNNLK